MTAKWDEAIRLLQEASRQLAEGFDDNSTTRRIDAFLDRVWVSAATERTIADEPWEHNTTSSRPLTREDLELAFANVAETDRPPWFCLPSAVVDQMTEAEVVLYGRVQMEQWVFGMSHPGAVDRLRAVVERIEAALGP